MLRRAKIFSKRPGLSPGTLVHVGERRTETVRIRLIDYNKDQFNEREIQTIDEIIPYMDNTNVTWVNIDGLHEVGLIQKIGENFGLHSLVLEDIVHTQQRPKLDDYESYLFIISKTLSYDQEQHRVDAEQFSLVLRQNFILTFQESAGDVFDPVRERLKRAKGRIRKMGPDYLAYALIDAIVDNYFIVLEKITEEVEYLDEELLADPTPDTVQRIHHLKRELIFLRKSIWPLRELIGGLERGGSVLIQKKTMIFLRDVYDHTIQVIDMVETLRDMVSGMLDVYLSSVSNKMNQVMKVLTIIATIFIPITFIAGVYGMNFEFMPELKWRWAYPVVWAVMIALGVTMLFVFKRKKWL